MRTFSFESQGTNTYLVYKVQEDDILDSMSLGMLTNNKIPGLAQTQVLQMDADKFIKYNVSAKVSVRQFFEGAVNKKRLIGVLRSVVTGLLSAEEYMIDLNGVLLDLDYIYADVSSCEAYLICLPICDMAAPPLDLGGFFKNIMFTTRFDQTENCDHVARIMNFLNSTSFSLPAFKALLDDIAAQTAVPKAAPQPVARPVVQQPAAPAAPAARPAQPVQAPVAQPKPAQPVAQPAPQPKVAVPQPAAQPKVQVPAAPQAPAAPAAPAGKQISMAHLLMHYSKENVAAYKAQQAAKKQAAAAAPAPQKKDKKEKKAKAAPAPMGFAVPGQPAPQPAAQVRPAQPVQTPVAQPKAQPAPQPAPAARPAASQPAPAYVPPQAPQGQPMNFGETVCLGGGATLGGTTVLGAAQTAERPVQPHLIRLKNNEKIPVNKPVFRVGKEGSYVDYFIGDNPAVSRSHANLLIRDDGYFIVDTNSTNHTHVNGERIQPNTEVSITHGDKIRLANEEFEFKLY